MFNKCEVLFHSLILLQELILNTPEALPGSHLNGLPFTRALCTFISFYLEKYLALPCLSYPLEDSPCYQSSCIKLKVKVLVLSLVCLFATPQTVDCSSVHGILQARIREWVAILFSRGSS